MVCYVPYFFPFFSRQVCSLLASNPQQSSALASAELASQASAATPGFISLCVGGVYTCVIVCLCMKAGAPASVRVCVCEEVRG